MTAATVAATGTVTGATVAATGALTVGTLGVSPLTIAADGTITTLNTVSAPSIYQDGRLGYLGAGYTTSANVGRITDGSGVILYSGIKTPYTDIGDVWTTSNGANNTRYVGLPAGTVAVSNVATKITRNFNASYATYRTYAANKLYLDTSGSLTYNANKVSYDYYTSTASAANTANNNMTDYINRIAGYNFITADRCSAMGVQQSIKLPGAPTKQTYGCTFDKTNMYAVILTGNGEALGNAANSNDSLLVKISRQTGALLASVNFTNLFKGIKTDFPGSTTGNISETSPASSTLVYGRPAPELIGTDTSGFVYVMTGTRTLNHLNALVKLNKSDLSRVWGQKMFNAYAINKCAKSIKIVQPTSGANSGKTLIVYGISSNPQYGSTASIRGYSYNYEYWKEQGNVQCFNDTSGSSAFSDGSGGIGGVFNNTPPVPIWDLNFCPKILNINDTIPAESFAKDSSTNVFVNTDSSGTYMRIIYPIVAVMGSALPFPGTPALAGGQGSSDWSYPTPLVLDASGNLVNPVAGMAGQPGLIFCTANVYKDASGGIFNVTVDGSGNPNNIYFVPSVATPFPSFTTYKHPTLRTAEYLVTLGFRIDATTSDSSNNVTFDKLSNNSTMAFLPTTNPGGSFHVLNANVPFTLTDGDYIWNDDTPVTGCTDGSGTIIPGNQVFLGQAVYKKVYLGDKIKDKYEALNLNYWGAGVWGAINYDPVKNIFYIPTGQGHAQPRQDTLDIGYTNTIGFNAAAYTVALEQYTTALDGSGSIVDTRAAWISATQKLELSYDLLKNATISARYRRFLMSGLVAVNESGTLLWYDSAVKYDNFSWQQGNQSAMNQQVIGTNGDNTIGACIVTTAQLDSSGNNIRRLMTADKSSNHVTYNPDATMTGLITANSSANNYQDGILGINLSNVLIKRTTVGAPGVQGGAVWGGCSDGTVFITHQANVPLGSNMLRATAWVDESNIMNGNPQYGTQYNVIGGKPYARIGWVSNVVVQNDQGSTASILDASGNTARLIPCATSYLVATDCMTGNISWACPCSPSVDYSLTVTDSFRDMEAVTENGPPTGINDVAIVPMSNGKLHFVKMANGAMMNTMCFPDGGMGAISATRDTLYVIGGARKWSNFLNTPVISRMHVITMNGM